jgi:hypothetical protein
MSRPKKRVVATEPGVSSDANMDRPAIASTEVEPPHVGVNSSRPSGPPVDAAAQLTWPQRRRPEYQRWEEFVRYPNFWEAHIIGGLLRAEGLPTRIEFMWPSLDLMSYSVVWVPKGLSHRARWILAWPPPTDAELTFLATGEMGPAEESEIEGSGGSV